MGEFRYAPAKCIPFRDLEAIERVRKIRRKDITKHWNPEFKISVLPAAEIEFRWLMYMFYRIKTAADAGTTCVLITPQP